MKLCPQCRRDYYDDSLLYCLDDGASLLEGPASMDEPATAVIPPTATREDSTRLFASAERNTDPRALPTVSRRNSIIAGTLGVVLVVALGLGGYVYYGRGSGKQIDSIAVMPFVNESGSQDIE